ncbi:hypothetical protein [Leptospira santarosai]|uniref:hypothetical protein n=1 Tax=Leptospira santarosai TaxID=28183 RepID=UPI0006286726
MTHTKSLSQFLSRKTTAKLLSKKESSRNLVGSSNHSSYSLPQSLIFFLKMIEKEKDHPLSIDVLPKSGIEVARGF